MRMIPKDVTSTHFPTFYLFIFQFNIKKRFGDFLENHEIYQYFIPKENKNCIASGRNIGKRFGYFLQCSKICRYFTPKKNMNCFPLSMIKKTQPSEF